ncbi:hypothetical protein [Vibrio barjaei]|uniref:hypothetical protein n=1 Tax=Vibrio barjaei TaxID=1676683 RepID=UPI002284CDD1|nr:hypothetical protein [Vibrio barjaei]MCY9873002.1 hypothetical protein [Vibrio barjaei]
MSDLIALYLAHRLVANLVFLFIALAVLYWTNRERINLAIKASMFTMPLIGRNKRLAKNVAIDDRGWFNSEKEVGNAFMSNYDEYRVDSEHYEQSSVYLNKVGDTGVKPMGFLMWTMLAVMVLIEAAGFAYVLAGFTIVDGTEDIQLKAAAGIALLVSILLMGFTHATGGELYRNQQIGKVRLRWSGDANKTNIVNPDNTVGLRSKTNSRDDESPSWQQMANRLDKVNANFSKSWTVSIITLVLVVGVAMGATYVRGQVLERVAIAEAASLELESEADPFAVSNPFENEVPESVMDEAQASDAAVIEQSMDAFKRGGWMTFIVLAIIFVAMQVFSIYLGFRSTFSGRESAEAYKATHEFANVDEYIAYHDSKRAMVERVAQSVLSHLQLKIEKHASLVAGNQSAIEASQSCSQRTFVRYYAMRELDKENVNDTYVRANTVAQVKVADAVTVKSDGNVVDLSQEQIILAVRQGKITDLSDEQVVWAMRRIAEMNAEAKEESETEEERMARLMKQAQG